MATGFKYVSYTTDAGTVVQLRMSAQAQAFTGQGPLNTAIDDKKIFAFASNPGSKRKKALNARGVVLGRTVGVAPNTFVRRTFVPITTKGALDLITINTAVPAYGGQAWTVIGAIDEA
jgi:hypothetical protein